MTLRFEEFKPALMQEWIGVKFAPSKSVRSPWLATIRRCSREYRLGVFSDPEAAARVCDNAAHYLSAWGPIDKKVKYNFPNDYMDEAPPILISVARVREILRTTFPTMEKSEIERRNLSETQLFNVVTVQVIEHARESLLELQYRFSQAVKKLELCEAQLAQATTELEQRDRVIEGLRTQGSHQYFKKVNNETVRISKIEADLL